MVEADALLSGLSLPDYRPVRRIGQGGMASVYRTVQISLGREIALKVLNPAYSDLPAFSERFLTEGRLLASLNHPNIVTIYDIGAHKGWLYIAMELLEGGSLRPRIQRGIDVDDALATAASIASALRNAHRKGIVHRDVKPTNILYRHDDSLVLTDFGIAKVLGEDSSLSRSGSTLGSPYYLSPEQAQGRPVDARTDVYSLGVILYEMLAGAKPFVGSSEIDTAMRHVSDPVPCLPSHLADLQPLIDRTLAKAPDERFDEMGELIEALEAARSRCAQRVAQSSPPGPPTVLGPAEDERGDSHTRTVDLAADASASARPGRPAVTRRLRPSASRWRRHRRAAAALTFLGAAGLGLSALIDEPIPAGASEPPVLAAVSSRDRHPTAPRLTPHPDEPRTKLGREGAAPPREAGPGQPSAPGLESGNDGDVPSAAPDSAAEVERLLAAMDRALAEFRLTSPAGNNAAELIERILALDPGNRAAQAGRARIADRYALLAERSVDEGAPERARVYVRRGLSVAPGHARLSALQTELETSTVDKPRIASDEPDQPEGLLERIKTFFSTGTATTETADRWSEPIDPLHDAR